MLFPMLGFAFAGALHAQCDFSGEVFDGSTTPGCGLLIYNTLNGEWLLPVNDPGLAAGQSILFSYSAATNDSSSCPSVIPVELTCFLVVSSPNSSGAPCSASFQWSAESGNEPLVTFFPPLAANANTLLDYFWDFGDGTSSTEAAPVHQFNQLGVFNVCLTVGGITCLSANTCNTLSLFGNNPCQASFEYQAVDGNVTFTNTTGGTYGGCSWDFGDGTLLDNQPLLDYGYDVLGFFPVCLTVWNADGCLSEICDEVFTGSQEIICDYADCVYPGDADGSGAANVYDLLNIGVGYGTEGLPRENSSNAWSPQYADNWGQTTSTGVNFKHIDSNGDGLINEFDAEAIEMNYGEPGSVFNVQAYGSPAFWLDFELDSIVIDDSTPAYFEIEADLMAGTPAHPVNNLRGFALSLDYPQDMVKEDGVLADYYDNSMLGSSNHILWLSKNRATEGNFDLGFTKKNNQANGYGKIADITFIVISDVLGRSEEEVMPFTVPVNGVVAVNPAGELLTVGMSEEATVFIVNKTTTAVKNASWLERQVAVFPNPATDKINIEIVALQAERLEVYNSLGQQLLAQEVSGSHFKLDTKGWQSGVWLLKIFTEKGVATKRAVID